jgi:hypothetical protein
MRNIPYLPSLRPDPIIKSAPEPILGPRRFLRDLWQGSQPTGPVRAIPGTAAVGIGPMDHALTWAHSSRLGDIIGYVASALVLATFSMRSMRPLRLTAIASNLAFIAYAAIGSMPPILILHSILLPMNVMRLSQMDHDTGHQGVRLLRRLSRLHVRG